MGVFIALSSTDARATDSVRAMLVRYNDQPHASLTLPLPDDDQLARLSAGDVISFRERIETASGDTVYRVVALAELPTSRLAVWVATLGSVETNASRLLEVKLGEHASGSSIWYQYVNLPWPIADRHWTIRSRARTAVAASTGVWWEHGWSLMADGKRIARDHIETAPRLGISQRQFDRAVYLPTNTGGWLMAPLSPDATLVAVHATAELGGGLPDGWVARYVSRQLTKQMRKMRERAPRAGEILASSHALYTGRGVRIEAQMLAQPEELSCLGADSC